MANYTPKVPLDVGDMMVIDGDYHKIVAGPEDIGAVDEYKVETNGHMHDEHIDWFYQQFSNARNATIIRQEGAL